MSNESQNAADAPLVIGGEFTLNSRLLVGTGKYASFEETAKALEISGTEMVTVAIRRVNSTFEGRVAPRSHRSRSLPAPEQRVVTTSVRGADRAPGP